MTIRKFLINLTERKLASGQLDAFDIRFKIFFPALKKQYRSTFQNVSWKLSEINFYLFKEVIFHLSYLHSDILIQKMIPDNVSIIYMVKN